MALIKKGRQTWEFDSPIGILGQAAVCGPKEGKGPLADDFDVVYNDNRFGEVSFEKAEQKMEEKAARLAISKAGLVSEDIDLFLTGDLINQLTPSGFTARNLGIPCLGLFAACATIMEAISLAALSLSAGAASLALALSGSHTCTAEKQFRYPNEYGGQKPPYSQTTATAAGAALLAARPAKVQIKAVTIGIVHDEKISDPFQMGAAMAPAFVDTVHAHLKERNIDADYYDLIISGDLGQVGQAIAKELFALLNVQIKDEQMADCGLMLFGGAKEFFSGGSGSGCAAAVSLGHIYNQIACGKLNRVLIGATGALLSPVANQQKESIPGICHAIALERGIANGRGVFDSVF
jgi:stage V sporulation protein AD